jgi:hypothetical protein
VKRLSLLRNAAALAVLLAWPGSPATASGVCVYTEHVECGDFTGHHCKVCSTNDPHCVQISCPDSETICCEEN